MNFAFGHNLLITGQADIGKSKVIKAFIGKAKEAGKVIGVVCSSGIACQVYDRGVVSTVHSFYGLSTQNCLGDKKLIARLKSLQFKTELKPST